MPWKVFREGGKFCVHKESADGGKGEKVACHASRDEANAQLRALYASESKEKGLDLLEDELENMVKCSYPGEMVYAAYNGATSFEEVELLESERERTYEINELVGQYQSLINNVVVNTADGIDLSKIDALHTEFKDRITLLIDEKGAEDEDKEKWTVAYENNLPDSAFLFVEPGGKKDAEGKTIPRSLRHLPVRDASGRPDAAHVRNAISRAAQVKMKNGKRISPEKARQLQSRARVMLSKLKEEWGVIDEVKSALKLRKEQDGSEMMVWKDLDTGIYHWLAVYSNNIIDDDDPPDILSSESHQKFVEFVDKGLAPLPELWLWHVEQWKIGHATAVAYDDSGFPVAIGDFDKGCEDIAEWLSKQDDFAVSHGMPYSSIKRDPDDNQVIVEYITREISPLPRWSAANKRTNFLVEIENKENDEMIIPAHKRQELIDLGLSPQALEALEKMTSDEAEKARQEGLKSKEITDPPTEDTTPPVEVTPAPPTEEPVTREEIANSVVAVFNPIIDDLRAQIGQINTMVGELAGQVKQLKETDESRIAKEAMSTTTASLAAMIAKNIGFDKTAVPLKKDDELLDSKPKETLAPAKPATGISFIDNMLAGEK